MKKISFLFLIACSGYFLSCTPKESGRSEKAQKNLDAMNGIGKAFETKDFSKLGDYVADDAIDHAGEEGDIKGLANMKAQFEKMSAATTNDKMETIKQLVDDEYGVTWMNYSGTMKTDNMGMKAGQTYQMKAMEIAKFRDGKLVEHWSYMDPAEMMKMMMPVQSQMPVDSAKKDSMMKK